MSINSFHNKYINTFLENCKKAPAWEPDGPNQAFKLEKLNGQRPDPISETKSKPSKSLWGEDFFEVPNECAVAVGTRIHGEWLSNEDPEWHDPNEPELTSERRQQALEVQEQEYDVMGYPADDSDLI